MFKKTQKVYERKTQLTHFRTMSNDYRVETMQKTTYWFLWVIPVFSKEEVLESRKISMF